MIICIDTSNELACYYDGKQMDIEDELYALAWGKPNYPMPAKLELPVSFISALWLASKHGKQERKVRRWWLRLCFDDNDHYLG